MTLLSTNPAKRRKVDKSLIQWCVLLVGEFTVQPCAELMRALHERGASIASSLTENCTHVVIGSVDAEKSLTEVKSKCSLPVVRERAMWAIINGEADDVRFAKPSPTAGPDSSLEEKIRCAFHALCSEGNREVSLAEVEMQLADSCEDDFLDVDWNTKLMRAVDDALEKGTIVKNGYLYSLKDSGSQHRRSCSSSWARGEVTRNGTPLPKSPNVSNSVDDVWKGLSWVREEKSSGDVSCFVCNSAIENEQTAVQLRDECLFQIIEERRQDYENAMRDREHEPFPPYTNVVRKDISVHESCLTEADKMCKREFEMDWAEIEPELESFRVLLTPKVQALEREVLELDKLGSEMAVGVSGGRENDNELSSQQKIEETAMNVRGAHEQLAEDLSPVTSLPQSAARRPPLPRPRDKIDTAEHPACGTLPESAPRRIPTVLQKKTRIPPTNLVEKATTTEHPAFGSSHPNLFRRVSPVLRKKNGGASELVGTSTTRKVAEIRKPQKRIVYRPRPPTIVNPQSVENEAKVEEDGEWRGLKRMSSKETKQGGATCAGCYRQIEKGQTQVKMKNDSMYYQVEDLKIEMAEIWGKKRIPGLPFVSKGSTVLVHDECEEMADEKCEKRFQREWCKIRDKVKQKTAEARARGELKKNKDEEETGKDSASATNGFRMASAVQKKYNTMSRRR